MAKKSSTDWPSGLVAGFVLAGGKSLRMGHDKAMLPWKHSTLLNQMIRLLSTVAKPVRIVGRADLPDRFPDLGPLGGLLTALEASETDKNLVLAVDLPLVSLDFLRAFSARLIATPRKALACKIGTGYPLCLGVGRTLLPTLSARLQKGELAVRDFIESVESEILTERDLDDWGIDAGIFANVNTPEDWHRLMQANKNFAE